MSKLVTRYYRIAGIGYRICMPRGWEYPHDSMFAPFRVAEHPAQRTICFHILDQPTDPTGERIFSDGYRSVYRDGSRHIITDGGDNPYLRLERLGNDTQVQLARRAIPQYITTNVAATAMELASDLIRQHCFLLHASYIRHNGKAILFTAPSGTGKSTQADLWGRYRGAQLLNGDRVAVEVSPEGVFAHGVPFCGSSGISENVTTPVLAIVSLSQAPRTTISPLTGLAAFRQVWEGCTVNHWNRQCMTDCMDLVSQVVQTVPVFHLACTPDQSAVEALEGAITDLR